MEIKGCGAWFMGLSGCLGGFVVGVYPNQRVKINDL